MAFRVEPTAQAQRDLDRILEWLLEQGAGEAGLRWFFKLEDAIASLADFPYRHRLPRRARNSLSKCASSCTDADLISTGCSTPLTTTQSLFFTSGMAVGFAPVSPVDVPSRIHQVRC